MTGSANVLRGIAVAGAAAVLLAGCGSPSERSEQDGADDDVVTLRVGATPLPHAEILAFVNDELAADAGLAIDVVEYTDYNQPNAALTEGELDANYYQTRPFLEEYLAGNDDADLEYVSDVHLEAFGLYSQDVADLDDLSEGAEIAVPNDVSNMGRALNLLAANDVITLAEGAGESPEESDIENNPLDITLTPVEAAQLPRSLQDVDAAVVNGNYALEADLPETANALAWEETEGSVYGNGLVVRSEDVDAEDIVRLNELLHSQEVRDFMEERWQGIVIPMDGAAEPQDGGE
ncbi:MetQ/NlpA family ABC transporter substrate-binding protein [Nocardiopsis sp. MG754419]|uniref:MetQ/NlpA family ABC transporter substrate-binding protein n=1 Tax=Nocardiopsis sp. MG754419 TaxID=2259865 RepID=UPI001BACC1C4|nr:MetQ/NlpA family ABC transporter substrate-binding protein [Nocardiopsis sp. MG754419]MBR8742524.1 metal ABC transporter substrate-binding protein [Nocardiopsis sp. MG754419]